MTSTAGLARIIGTLRRTADGKGAVRVEDLYDTDIDDLWSALTEPRRLTRWLAEVDGDLRIGGLLHARFTSGWEGAGRVETCQAPHRLTLTMAPGTPDETVIDAELTPQGGKTRLVIEERGISLDQLPFHGAGWQAHVEDLATHIQGRQPGDWHARWTALTPAYQNLPVAP